MSEIFAPLARGAAPRYFDRRTRNGEPSSITCHEYAVPAEIEPEIERLYQNIFSSLSHFKAYGGLTTDTCTYVAREKERAVAIFLFRRVGKVVLVLNEGMQVNEHVLNDFVRYVFSRWQQVALVVFQAIRPSFKALEHPFQRHECTAQVTMPLPATEDVYLASLGKNMRRNIRRYQKRLLQDHPSFRFDVFGPHEVPADYLQAIFNLSRTRIAGMNRNFALEDEAGKIFDLARMTGLVGVATLDGKVCGGMIGFRTGDTYFAKVLGHDAAYKDYSLGILCCYQMIVQCIARGCREFNFMWNEYPYKAALGGGRLNLERLVIYRSRMQMLRHSGFAARVALEGWRFRATSLLDKEDMQETLSPAERRQLQTLLWLRNYWRKMRGSEGR